MESSLKSPTKGQKKIPLLSNGQLFTQLNMNHQFVNKNKSLNNINKVQLNQNNSQRLNLKRPSPIKISNDIKNIQITKNKINNGQQHVDNSKLLDQLLYQSQKIVRKQKMAYDKIKEDKQRIQKKVYSAQTNSEKQYLQQMYDQVINQNQFINNGLQNIFEDIQKGIENDIYQKELFVREKKSLTKDDLLAFQNIDKYRLLKIKQGKVKNKIGNLKNQMEVQYLNNKNKIKFATVDVIQHNYYSYNHPKTKESQQFVRKLNHQRQQYHKRKQQHLIAKNQQLMKIKQQQNFYKDQQKRRKHEQLIRKYQQKVMQKMEQAKLKRAKEYQFNQWKKKYDISKPLYVRKQQQFYQNHEIPKNQHMKQQIMRKKAMNQPIDSQQINQHQLHYLQYKQDDRIRKKAQIQIKNQQQQIRTKQINGRLYKGKARYYVLKDMLQKKEQQNPKDIVRDKKIRQIAYSQDIRQRRKLRNQTIKQMSARQARNDKKPLVARVRNGQGSLILSKQNQARSKSIDFDMQSQKDYQPYQQGIKNLRFLKQMIRQHVDKGAVKPHIKLLEQRDGFKPNYLQQLKQKRLKNNSLIKKFQHDIDQSNNHQSIKAKLESLDQKVKQKQLQKKYESIKNIQNQAQLQQGYLASIKVKLKLLTNFD